MKITNSYFDKSVSKDAVFEFINKNLVDDNEIQTIEIYKKNKLMVRFAPKPYDCAYKCEKYSVSKTFTASAIGIAVDEGILTVEDRIVDIFPDKVPPKISKNLASMKVKHLLCMNTGHADCTINAMRYSDDSVKTFMELDIPYKPGTHFTYNTGASFVLSSIITKLTGLSLLDYLNVKLLSKLEIKDVYWEICGEDRCMGGAGLNASCDDVSKLGLLYINKGVWKGEQLISKKWIKNATKLHSDTKDQGTADWTNGYGYQCWMNAKDGYRMDGALGQLCMIFPKTKTVVTLTSETGNVQTVIDNLYEMIEKLYDKEFTSDINIPEYYPASTECDLEKLDIKWGTFYACEPNAMNMSVIRLLRENGNVVFEFSNGHETQKITAGNGEWKESVFYARMMKPTLVWLMPNNNIKKIHMLASYKIVDNIMNFKCRLLNTVQCEYINFKLCEQTLSVNFRCKSPWLAEESKYLVAHEIY